MSDDSPLALSLQIAAAATLLAAVAGIALGALLARRDADAARLAVVLSVVAIGILYLVNRLTAKRDVS